MLEKLASSCEGGGGGEGAGPPPFTIFAITFKVAVYAPPPPLFHLYPYVLVCGLETELGQQHTSIMSVAG
jgi:hypothetical protein